MNFGFTGTRSGMTDAQKFTVERLLRDMEVQVLRHGGAIGSDTDAHYIALRLGVYTIIYPSTVPGTQGRCEDANEVLDPMAPLFRNKTIVRAGKDGLIATPDSRAERIRSGTWQTVRFARNSRRCIWIVYPTGNVKFEYYTFDSVHPRLLFTKA